MGNLLDKSQDSPEVVHVAVLAGGISRIPLFKGDQTSCKALLTLGGKPCIQYVLDALEVQEVGRTCLVGPEKELREILRVPSKYEYVPSGGSFGESIFRSLDHFRDADRVLFVTADLPLLTRDTVADFLAASLPQWRHERQIFLSGVPASCFTGPYRHAPKPCSHFRDVSVCHGNLALLSPKVLESGSLLSRARLDNIYRHRKRRFLSSLSFGWPFVLGYALGFGVLRPFKLDRVLQVASRYFRLELIPVLLEHPGAALDIDEPQDYAFAADLLERRRG